MFFARFVNFVRSTGINVFPESRDVQRIFVRRVSFGFGNSLRRTGDFLYLRLLVVVLLAGPFSAFVCLLELVLIVFVLFDFRRRPFVV